MSIYIATEKGKPSNYFLLSLDKYSHLTRESISKDTMKNSFVTAEGSMDDILVSFSMQINSIGTYSHVSSRVKFKFYDNISSNIKKKLAELYPGTDFTIEVSYGS